MPRTRFALFSLLLAGCAHEPFRPATAAVGYVPDDEDRVALQWVPALVRDDRGTLARLTGVGQTKVRGVLMHVHVFPD